MAYSTIPKSSSYFNTKLYSGSGAIQTVSGVGFEPSWIWTKSRTNAGNHQVTDQVRGLTKYIRPNATNAEDTKTNAITAVNSDGFVLGADSSNDINASGQTYASWNWKANGQGSANTDGSINTTYTSVDTTSGFSISTYTGTGSAGTIGHGLGVAPAMIIVKRLTGSAEAWTVYHQSLDVSAPQDKYLHLNSTDAVMDSAGMWNDTAPTTSVFSVGSTGVTNGSGGTFVAYCFAEKTGYSKFGSYTGNGNADGPFAYTGFKPTFILIKSVSTTNWNMFDNKRSAFNVADETLWANSTDSEATVGTSYGIDILSNGFKAKTVSSQVNNNNTVHIFMAFGQPIVSTNNVIATAR